MINNKKTKKAFSLIEVLVSVFLVSVGLLATLALLTSGLRETMDSRNQLIASLLAQEGAELVRNIRDNNWVLGGGTFDNISIVNNQNISYDSALNGGPSRLKINADNLYSQNGDRDTRFFRKIDISGGADEKIILSMVLWDGTNNFPAKADCDTTKKCAYVEDTLTNWGE